MIDRQTTPPRRTAKRCGHPHCPARTREGKPRCSEHIDDLPYVSQVAAGVAQLEAERDLLKKRKTPRTDWMLVEELLLTVAARKTVMNRGQICRELDVDPPGAEALARVAGLKPRAAERTLVYLSSEAARRLEERGIAIGV